MPERRPPDELVPREAWEIAKSKLLKWGLVTTDPLLLIAHLTVIYIALLIADTSVLVLIEWTLIDLVKQSEFAQTLLKGTKVFSALVTAIAYALHLIYSLYLQARHVAKKLKESEGAGEPECCGISHSFARTSTKLQGLSSDN